MKKIFRKSLYVIIPLIIYICSYLFLSFILNDLKFIFKEGYSAPSRFFLLVNGIISIFGGKVIAAWYNE